MAASTSPQATGLCFLPRVYAILLDAVGQTVQQTVAESNLAEGFPSPNYSDLESSVNQLLEETAAIKEDTRYSRQLNGVFDLRSGCRGENASHIELGQAERIFNLCLRMKWLRLASS